MPNLLEKSRDWLNQKMKSTTVGGRSIHYQRGESIAPMSARFCRIDTTIDESSGVDVRAADQDWLIDAADLVIDGSPTSPLPGDRIIDGDLGDGKVYEVAKISGMDAWRWSDPYQKTYHIHTKYLGLAPVTDA